ncbi:hypothetical protein AW168_33780 [Nocardia brasiliensis]|nr:hypothetical protein AW168_33780 [Nocardia brasiliensis]
MCSFDVSHCCGVHGRYFMPAEWVAIARAISMANSLSQALARNDLLLEAIGRNRADTAKRLAQESENLHLSAGEREDKRRMALGELEGAYTAALAKAAKPTGIKSWFMGVPSEAHNAAARAAVSLAVANGALGRYESKNQNMARARKHFEDYIERREDEERWRPGLEGPIEVDLEKTARERAAFAEVVARVG